MRWGPVVLVVCLGLLSGSLIACGETEESSSEAPATTREAAAPEDKSPPEPAKPPSAKQRLRDALDDASPSGAGEVEVQHIDYGRSLTITLKTPEGGLQGASTHDLDNSVAAALKAVYGKAEYPARKETVIIFKGGLVSTETGKDLPDVNTAIYTIKGSQARQIDWSDDDAINYNIDWGNYRDFVHPAIKAD